MPALTRHGASGCGAPATARVTLAHRPSVKWKTNNPLSVFSKYHLWERKLHSEEACATPSFSPSLSGKLLLSRQAHFLTDADGLAKPTVTGCIH